MSLADVFRKYQYYDKPEGHSFLQKTIALSKIGASTGLFIGLHDCILVSKTKTVYDTTRCLGFWMIPLIGMSTAFVSTTYIATNLRKKDDPWNYVMGALASGVVLNAWSKCGLTTLYGTLGLCIFAAIKKDSIQSGWTFFPEQPFDCGYSGPIFQTSNARVQKFERGWTT